MNYPPMLTALNEEERAQALARFRLLQPYFEGQATLRAVAQTAGNDISHRNCNT